MTIQAYKTNQTTAMKATDFIALLLTKASCHIKTSMEAMGQKDHEKQFFFSNIACEILQGLSKYVNCTDPEQAKVGHTLKNYYNDMMILITRMNVKSDLKAAQAIIISLEQISEMWRAVGRQADPVTTPPPLIAGMTAQVLCHA